MCLFIWLPPFAHTFLCKHLSDTYTLLHVEELKYPTRLLQGHIKVAVT